MLRRFAGAKLHRATITESDLNYEGSIGIDTELLEKAGMYPGEIVSVFNINNGSRLETYILPLPRGCRKIALNGAAARLGAVGDRVIIVNFLYLNESEIASHHFKVLLLDEGNNIVGER